MNDHNDTSSPSLRDLDWGTVWHVDLGGGRVANLVVNSEPRLGSGPAKLFVVYYGPFWELNRGHVLRT